MDQSVCDRGAPHASDDDGEAAAFRCTAPHIDGPFYLARNHDVRDAGVDAALHYWHTGWREGRDPNAWFHTDHYLSSYRDVRDSGANPLWHFVTRGRREGRLARPNGDAWRAALQQARPPAQRRTPHGASPGACVLDGATLHALLAPGVAVARGLVVAVSHDRYCENPGGTQLLIADEQRKCNGDNAVYLHLSPVEPGLGLAPASPEPQWLHIVLDGRVRGIATAGSVALGLGSLPAPVPRLLVVHNLHGHCPEIVAELAAALQPRHAVFWVHDYGAACASPRLLRNDIAFCHAPPQDSMGCRICVYGEARASERARLSALFHAVPFHVVAPSARALALWQRAAGLPHAGASVHPHTAFAAAAAPARRGGDGPPRVAFVGHAAFHKGWGLFRDLIALVGDAAPVRFYQLASTAELVALDGVAQVAAETSPARPFGMAQALAAHDIDLVLALSPWPETYGYVAHEALAAGADVLTTALSGHVADLVRQSGRGIVFADAAALVAFFAGGEAAGYVRDRRAAARPALALRHCGSTATLAPGGRPGTAMTADPDLQLVLDSVRHDGCRTGNDWRFDLPPAESADPARAVRLRSRHIDPLWEDSAAADPRRLGVAVAELALDGAPVPAGDPRRAAGWHRPEPDWQWTDGDATVVVGTARAMTLRLLPLARYWRVPLLDG